jgi:hypothetical protein
MNKSINSCLKYYLSTFKKSDDYRLLKTVCAEERADKLVASEEHGLDACGVCGVALTWRFVLFYKMTNDSNY